jgi:hypothetical protein
MDKKQIRTFAPELNVPDSKGVFTDPIESAIAIRAVLLMKLVADIELMQDMCSTKPVDFRKLLEMFDTATLEAGQYGLQDLMRLLSRHNHLITEYVVKQTLPDEILEYLEMMRRDIITLEKYLADK